MKIKKNIIYVFIMLIVCINVWSYVTPVDSYNFRNSYDLNNVRNLTIRNVMISSILSIPSVNCELIASNDTGNVYCANDFLSVYRINMTNIMGFMRLTTRNITTLNLTYGNKIASLNNTFSNRIETLNSTFGNKISSLNNSLGKNYNTTDEMIIAVNTTGYLINWSQFASASGYNTTVEMITAVNSTGYLINWSQFAANVDTSEITRNISELKSGSEYTTRNISTINLTYGNWIDSLNNSLNNVNNNINILIIRIDNLQLNFTNMNTTLSNQVATLNDSLNGLAISVPTLLGNNDMYGTNTFYGTVNLNGNTNINNATYVSLGTLNITNVLSLSSVGGDIEILFNASNVNNMSYVSGAGFYYGNLKVYGTDNNMILGVGNITGLRMFMTDTTSNISVSRIIIANLQTNFTNMNATLSNQITTLNYSILMLVNNITNINTRINNLQVNFTNMNGTLSNMIYTLNQTITNGSIINKDNITWIIKNEVNPKNSTIQINVSQVTGLIGSSELVKIKYQNITNIPVCPLNYSLTFNGSNMSCIAGSTTDWGLVAQYIDDANVAYQNRTNTFITSNVFAGDINITQNHKIRESTTNNSIHFEDGVIMIELQ